MNLGAFSISLTVKDLKKSQEFYQKLGFEQIGGRQEDNWLILRNNDHHVIGLFQGMFEGNILTFNPGWDQCCNPTESFTDVRDLQKSLGNKGVEFETKADESTSGPASFIIKDPDGNCILVDQHR